MKTIVFSIVTLSLGLALQASAQSSATSTKVLPKKTAKATAASTNMTTSNATESQKSVAVIPSQAPAILNKISVGALISQADTLEGGTLVAFGQKADLDLNSSTSMGLTVQMTDSLAAMPMNWYAGLNIEQTREISSVKSNRTITSNGSTTANIAQKPSFRPFIANGGVQYMINKQIYVLGGLNYTLYTETNSGGFRSFDMDPVLGYQVGAGISLSKINIELMQKQVNYNLSAKIQDDVNVEGQARLAGLNIQARYNF